MEEEYWKRFLKTGEIKDYLYYKGMGICRQVMESYGVPLGNSQAASSPGRPDGNRRESPTV